MCKFSRNDKNSKTSGKIFGGFKKAFHRHTIRSLMAKIYFLLPNILH